MTSGWRSSGARQPPRQSTTATASKSAGTDPEAGDERAQGAGLGVADPLERHRRGLADPPGPVGGAGTEQGGQRLAARGGGVQDEPADAVGAAAAQVLVGVVGEREHQVGRRDVGERAQELEVRPRPGQPGPGGEVRAHGGGVAEHPPQVLPVPLPHAHTRHASPATCAEIGPFGRDRAVRPR